MHKGILPITLLLLSAFSCVQPDETPTAQTKSQAKNEIVREYLSPERILWTSGEGVVNAERFLKPGTGQADLVGADLCTLVGNSDNPPSLLLDFGK